ncbi:MAG TPA: AmmeMemoRadiSam system protein B [Opitutaceae bacterium]|nr:AmmeMemoRadiSam system protein B [Opitutaceae bacterium]
MKRIVIWLTVGILPALFLLGTSAPITDVRPPAVAGLFYPRDPAALARTIDADLAAAKTARTGELRALICPHAGYPYSGPVAASGYRLLRGTHFTTVIVLGPAHHAVLAAGAVSGAAVYRTPLGDVPISPRARELGKTAPFAIDPPCEVHRPAWATSAAPPPTPGGAEPADAWEHSVEVQIPFLQRTLGTFALIPVVMGDVDPTRAARALEPLIDDSTLLIVSSDLSHYHSYAEAQRLDRQCVDAICALDLTKTSRQEACGRTPILTLLEIARHRGWRPELLDLRNSGDTAGDKSRVVGYAAIAFYAPAPSATALTTADRAFLLQLARQSVREAAVSGGLPPLSREQLPPELTARKAAFVTLTRRGELRGCIGHIFPQMPLYRAVAENARSATLYDPRFPPVTPREVGQLEIEISVLTDPKPLAFTSADDLLRKLEPHRDGVVLQVAAGTATYLPQVWEQLPDRVEFLDSLAVKAGGRAGDWRRPGTTVSIYHVESFQE